MSTVYYIYDKKGRYLSADRTKTYSRLKGKKLMDFLHSKDGRSRYFYRMRDDYGNITAFEITEDDMPVYEHDRRREKYVYENEIGSGYDTVSLDSLIEGEDGEELQMIETVADEDADTEEEAFRNMRIEAVRKARDMLTGEEDQFIDWLFPPEGVKPLTEKQISDIIGTSRQAFHQRKITVFKKLRRILASDPFFFSKNCPLISEGVFFPH